LGADSETWGTWAVSDRRTSDDGKEKSVLDAQAIGEAVDRTYQDLPPVSVLDQAIYAQIARFAFDEAEAWPSHDRIARLRVSGRLSGSRSA
jgi:hypothetical protein